MLQMPISSQKPHLSMQTRAENGNTRHDRPTSRISTPLKSSYKLASGNKGQCMWCNRHMVYRYEMMQEFYQMRSIFGVTGLRPRKVSSF